MLTKIRNKETGFSLLELSVAVGVAAIVAAAGIIATTAFIGSAQEKRDGYLTNADNSIENANASYDALFGEGGAGGGNPLLSFAYNGEANGTLAFTRGQASQSFTPNNVYNGASYSLSSGTLPTGVTLNPTNGALTGPADWGFNTTSAGGTGWDLGNHVALTSDGGAIIAGDFQGTATFGSTTLTSSGSYDSFVAKVDSSGNYVWAMRAGVTGYGAISGVAITSDNGAIITGRFQGTATFDSTTLTSAGNNDVFVAKFDSSGSFVWAARAGGTSSDMAYGVDTTSDNGAIITGRFFGTASFGSTTLTSSGFGDIFIAKVNSSGNFMWATKAGGTDNDQGGNSVAATSDGGAIIAGKFVGTATFGSTTLTSADIRDNYDTPMGDGFVAKVDSSGNFVWVTKLVGTRTYYMSDVAATNDGGAIITGVFGGDMSFGSTTLVSGDRIREYTYNDPVFDAFIAKVDSSGNFVWANSAGGGTRDVQQYGVTIASDGGAILTGYFNGTATFGSTTLTSSDINNSDVFVAKINSSGAFVWATRSVGGGGQGYSVAATSDGGAIAVGSFSGTISFGSTTLTSAGGGDVFVTKVNSSGAFSPAVIQGSTETLTITVTDGNNSTDYTVTVSTE
jgi:type II secretory pathway pseudopilin PulG